jgi:rare lipoprotein A (peptidoglycan hydrolase)
MPLRQTIGISLALLVISAGANAKDPDESPSHHHGHHIVRHERTAVAARPHGVARTRSQRRAEPHQRLHAKAHERSRRHAGLHERRRLHAARHERTQRRHHYVATVRRGDERHVDRWGLLHPAGRIEIGKAAFYRRIGARTASGERLDATTPTAAHRTLPLNSLARVTDLDNGRSVVVKINDRGPFGHHRLIDLSPRAAELLHMERAGIADVIVQPLARGPAPSERPATALAAYYGDP